MENKRYELIKEGGSVSLQARFNFKFIAIFSLIVAVITGIVGIIQYVWITENLSGNHIHTRTDINIAHPDRGGQAITQFKEYLQEINKELRKIKQGIDNTGKINENQAGKQEKELSKLTEELRKVAEELAAVIGSGKTGNQQAPRQNKRLSGNLRYKMLK